MWLCLFYFNVQFLPHLLHINRSHKNQTSGQRTEYHRDLHCIWAYCAIMFLFKRKHS